MSDSQAIVKSIIFNVVRLQLIDPDIKYYILFEGTDRLENVFSHARTQDHARNFDILQLAQKLSIGAEIDAIFQRYPDLDRGDIRRNLVNARGVDHINPKSWVGNVCVGDVNIVKEYMAGRDDANKIMVKQFGRDKGYTDFDKIFSDLETDHLQPGGKLYVGFHSTDSDEVEEEQDVGLLIGGLIGSGDHSENEFEDARETINSEEINNAVDADELNPSSKKNKAHYLEINRQEFYLPVLIKEYLCADKERRQLSTVRPLRARGVTIAQSLRGSLDGINSSGDTLDSPDGIVKAGDLGAVLTRVSDEICLAVVEVLNFRQGTSKNNLASVSEEDLDESGSKAVSVAVQFLEFLPQRTGDLDDNDGDFDWWWSRKYIQIQDSKDHTAQKRNFVTRIPGHILHLLTPTVCFDGDDAVEDGSESGPKPVWSLRNSDLKAIFDRAWKELNPEAEEIVENIKCLPKITGASEFTALPYTLLNGMPQFHLSKNDLPTPLTLVKLPGNSKVNCLLCNKSLLLQNMRNHVGIHLLKARYGIEETGVLVGNNPCGWCGSDSLGCDTHLLLIPSKASATTSSCKYHYKDMNYSKAAEFSDRTPCTNVLIHCVLCPLDADGTRATIWKYNLKCHLDMYHTAEDGQPEALPLELIVSSHITREEEEKIFFFFFFPVMLVGPMAYVEQRLCTSNYECLRNIS